ncbi:uncharacterized protein LOC125722638 [Brienomyrus brachyistius]|uniref:uncharacterized protein LOC125722638 n=1 Tax=Brienomyrus brachyistius TaxID=42636 RepID=UPI0020B222EC|nr:uncharacterized protein LOC125722638 [Brienomyrus brachyistius]
MATAGGPSRKPFSGPWLVAGGGLRNTTRFCWRAEGEVGTFPDRLAFIREVAFEALGLRMEDVLCVPRNGPFEFFEVTLSTDDSCSKVLERSKEGAQHPLLRRYTIEPLWWPDKRVITVHCFNPHVTAESVCLFLKKSMWTSFLATGTSGMSWGSGLADASSRPACARTLMGQAVLATPQPILTYREIRHTFFILDSLPSAGSATALDTPWRDALTCAAATAWSRGTWPGTARAPVAAYTATEVHLRDQRDEALFSRQWKRGRSYWSVGGVHSSGVGILFGDRAFEEIDT